MKLTVSKRYGFSASHRLHVPAFSGERNAALYGKCNNPFGHGHDYILDVSVAGEVDPETGKLFPLAQLDELVQHVVLSRFSYCNLNLDLPEFQHLVPTTENISLVIADLLAAAWRRYMPPSTHLSHIYIEETARNSFEVRLAHHHRLEQNHHRGIPAQLETATSHV